MRVISCLPAPALCRLLLQLQAASKLCNCKQGLQGSPSTASWPAASQNLKHPPPLATSELKLQTPPRALTCTLR